MIKIDVKSSNIFDIKSDGYAFIVEDGFSFSNDVKKWTKDCGVDLSVIAKQYKFTGKNGSSISVPITCGKKMYSLFFVGIGKAGKKKNKFIEHYRRAVGSVIRLAERSNVENLSLCLPCLKFGKEKIECDYIAEQTASIALLASYHFDDFISDKDRKSKQVKNLILVTCCNDLKIIKAGVEKGLIVGDAVNNARHYIDLPPRDFGPSEADVEARKIAKECGLKITVFNEKEVIKKGMGGLAGVSSGSNKECRFIILEYKTKVKNAPTIAFVGKGVTFDSGGLSLKPSKAMETMKEDMSGAAAVLSAMKAIGQLKPEVNVVGITPLAENLPGNSALMPGDIVTFYNGKTAEILNTDAEGRLILADALAYGSKHYKPDAMIDFATLTGVCQYALGPFYSGVFSCDDELVGKLEKSADNSGDKVWRLPLDNDYRKAIVSDVADIRNTGKAGYFAGATTAAFFLKEFVGDTSWAHIDIAGTAFSVPDISYYEKGGTGAGVRLMIDFALNWKK